MEEPSPKNDSVNPFEAVKTEEKELNAADKLLLPYLAFDINISTDPSYSNLALPYFAVCRLRYQQVHKEYHKQFIKEIQHQQKYQTRALDGTRINREFCNPVIRYPSRKDKIVLTVAQARRLGEIMNCEDF